MDQENAGRAAWAAERLADRRPAYEIALDYYEGRHRLMFATERFRTTFGRSFGEFQDNLCQPVVDALADRLQITGFVDNGAPAEEQEDAALPALALWRANRMDVQAGAVMQDTLTLGDSYVIVWQDEQGFPRIVPQMAHRIAVRYSDERPGEIEWAVKLWRQDKRWRVTVYEADQLTRWIAPNESSSFDLPTEYEDFQPLPEQPVVRNPWGVVPVFAFHNAAAVGRLGRPEHEQAIPLNDALNKSVLDMFVGMEFVALPQRWATGVEQPTDPVTGRPTEYTAAVERWFTAPDTDARFGQFEQARLTELVAVQDSFRAEIARVTGTPPHYLLLGGDFPSGEALKTAESRLVKRAQDRQRLWGPVWSACMTLALRMAQTPPHGDLETLWASAESRAERDQAETAAIKQALGVSNAQLQREMGYTQQQIDEMAAEREEEQQRDADAAAAAVAAGRA